MEELLADLPTLLRVARAGSLSRAAEQLGVPRSTVSRRLARLESKLGLPLAERTTRTFRLTPAGARLVRGAEGVLAELKTVEEQVQHEAGAVRGALRLASPPGLGGNFVGHFLAAFQRRHPGVTVELLITERQLHLLGDQVDVVLSTGALGDLPWMRRRLGRTWSIAVASPEYLKEHGTPEEPEALDAHVVLAGDPMGAAIHTWPRLKGPPVRVRPSLMTNDLPTLREAAVAGLGIALLPGHLMLDELARGALVHVLASSIGESMEIYALYPRERRRSPVLKAFFQSLDAFAAPLVANTPPP